MGAVLVAEGAAVGEEILVSGTLDEFFGRGGPFLLDFVCLENFLLASPGASLLPTALTNAGGETPSSLVSLQSFNLGIKSWLWRLECK